MTRKRICVDMDEVMADAIAEHLLRYNRDHAANLTKQDLHGKRFWQVVPEPHHEILATTVNSPSASSPDGQSQSSPPAPSPTAA